MCYRSERLLVYRDEEGSLLTRYNRRAVPPVRYSHDVALSIAKPDEALPLPAEKPVLSLVAFTTSGKEVARAYDYGPGPSRRGLSPAFELSLRPTGREKERSRYAREQRKRAPQREVRAVHPRARRAFFGAMPSPEPSYRLVRIARSCTSPLHPNLVDGLTNPPLLLCSRRQGPGSLEKCTFWSARRSGGARHNFFTAARAAEQAGAAHCSALLTLTCAKWIKGFSSAGRAADSLRRIALSALMLSIAHSSSSCSVKE